MNPDNLPASPRENANFLSKIFFCWLLPFFRLGSKRDLWLADLHRISRKNKSKNLGNDLEQAWKNQIRDSKKWNSGSSITAHFKKNPSLRKALTKVFFWEYAVLGISTFVDECIIKIAQPILLGLIIRYCEGKFGDTYGYLFGAGMFVSSAINTAQRRPCSFQMLQVGMKMRIACSSLIYRKALKLSQASIGTTTVDELTNRLSNDVKRFDDSVPFVNYLWITPVQLGIVTYILWNYFGWSSLIGISVLLVFVPFQSQLERYFGTLRQKIVERRDQRVGIMSEIVNAARTIKMYAWELQYAKLIEKARKNEIKYVLRTALLRAFALTVYDNATKVALFLTLLTYVLTSNGHVLNAEKVFVALCLHNNIGLTMTKHFPNGIVQLAKVLAAIKRIQDFLLLEERDASHRCGVYGLSQEVGEVVMVTVNARWSGGTNTEVNAHTLYDISLKLTEGQFLAVVGSVGSGKSSLLHVLLHELPCSAGLLEIKGKLAYTSQEPWIFSGSVRENILFGSEYENHRYQRVIEVCALSRDMELFPLQDQTIIGDRGILISGEQKAKINLARAVYSDADIYLFDDPLSSVDPKVAKYIFENCIMDFLNGKTKILVTHEPQFLKSANEIIMLNKGQIEARGSYEELKNMDINFTQALYTESQITPQTNSIIDDRIVNDIETSSETEMEQSADWTDDEIIVERRSLRSSKSLLPLAGSLKHTYGTFLSASSSENNGESEPLLLSQQQYEESRPQGKVYWKYISAGSSCFGLLILIVLTILVQLLFSGSDYWLQYWTNIEEKRASNTNSTRIEHVKISEKPLDFLGYIANCRDAQVYIYCGLVGTLLIVSLLRAFTFFSVCFDSCAELHTRFFHGVIKAQMGFFETTSPELVLNRFSKDIDVIDEKLPLTLFEIVQIALQKIGVVTIVSINNPYLAIPSHALLALFYFVRKFYLKTAKSVRHLEVLASGPVFSHLSTSLHGISTVRVYGEEHQFEKQFEKHQDLHTASWILFLATSNWLGIFVDWCCAVYIGVVTFTFIGMKGANSGSAVGLSIASALSLCGMLQWGVRHLTNTEHQIVSVDRVLEYAQIKPEGSFSTNPRRKSLKWPSNGEIVFANLVTKNGSSDPLKNLSCVIKGQEKVGIIDRTRSGTSSLINALFRITEYDQGNIQIDGLSIFGVGLHDLRKSISIIPQDPPVFFNGSLRQNLDPFEKYNDVKLWSILEQVHLADAVKESPAGLEMNVSTIAEGGVNFSVGQRQLICLGRAILRKNKILVWDEATANVDLETNTLIQKTIREKFAECTVLINARRLHTIIDSDRILVLDAGELKEFDEPYNLLSKEQGEFFQLVEATGKETAANLYKIAKRTYEKRRLDSIIGVLWGNKRQSAGTSST